MIECMRNAAREHMTLDEQISFCEEKSKNIKLKTEPQTFVDIKNSLEKLKELLKIAKSVDEAKSKGCNEISTALYYDGFNDGYSKALDSLLNSLPDCDYVGIEHLVCLVERLNRGEENDG